MNGARSRLHKLERRKAVVDARPKPLSRETAAAIRSELLGVGAGHGPHFGNGEAKRELMYSIITGEPLSTGHAERLRAEVAEYRERTAQTSAE